MDALQIDGINEITIKHHDFQNHGVLEYKG